MSTPISVMMVEDNPGDARLVELMLHEAGPGDFVMTRVDRLGSAIARLAEISPSVILVDLSLPDSHGLATLHAMRAAAPTTPIVVLTGTDDEATALQAIEAGAQDYLVKGRGDGDVMRRSVRYAIERCRADQALRRSEARFRAVFDNAVLGISLIDPSFLLVDANPALATMLGCERDALIGQPAETITHPDDRAALLRRLGDLFAGRMADYQAEKRVLRRDGAPVWARIKTSVARDGAGQVMYALAIFEDITERKRMEDRLRLAAQVFESTTEGIFVTDREERIIDVNPAFTELTGFAADEVVGRRPHLLASGRHDATFYQRIRDILKATGQWQGEVWNRRKSGELFAEWLNISAVRDTDGEVTSYVALFNDITLRKQNEERLTYQASHDPLTTLPNRMLFHERLSRALARAQRNGLGVALLFVDLDHFKEVNDQHGHIVGDALLQSVAERLTGCTRQGDTVARLAGDEFTVVLEDVTDFREAAIVAQKILAKLAEPFDLHNRRLSVSCSIGVSLFPGDGNDATTLLRSADEAMYQAKKQGKNAYRFQSETLNARAFERLALQTSLRQALERGQLCLHYQPIFDLDSGRVVAAEALLRWYHPEFGLVFPAHFLATADETGLSLPIGRWVLRSACAQVVAWQQAELPGLRLTINLSASQLRAPDCAGTIAAALRESGLPPESLELDLPEASVMGRAHDYRGIVTDLKKLGVRIAIDDFGTGYSSFSYLRRLPIDVLKVDQSFVRDTVSDADDAKIVAAITAIAHSLRMRVIAEGVETAEQLAFLRAQGCDMAQGFLLGRPMPPEEFLRLAAGAATALA